MSSINDLWISYLKSLGYTSNSFNDLIKEALQDINTSSTKSIMSLWKEYMEGQGYPGSLTDSAFTGLSLLGYSGSMNDRLFQSLTAQDLFGGGGGSPACAYPFDAGSAEVIDSGATPMTMTNDSQTASCVLTGTPNHEFEAYPENLWTLRATTGGTTFTPSDTVLGMQLNLDAFPKHSGGGSGYSVAYRVNLAFINKALNDRIYVCAETTDDGRAYPSLRNAAGAYVWEGLAWVDDILDMGIYHDPVNDRWGVITRTVTSSVTTTTDHGYIAALNSYGMTGEMYGFLEVQETSAAADTSGQTVTVNIITDANEWDLPFPDGTAAICTAIGA